MTLVVTTFAATAKSTATPLRQNNMTKTYTFERAEKIPTTWPKFRIETNLIGKKVAEHMANGWVAIN